ncbi:CoA transferase [Bradyrhizobium tropiciagri]|uniref:CaiB/BaiF CoA transferase family protein n=1 Tax=Bradyrhizobium tropiciagri TaxID=312253 RepID=UPI001BA47310|nr:CoA transferase [Bradyrhizobium tropiciagri]MBR0899039.1 CoA transferase [Bradyrhizobium tropiciagri]
MTDRIRQGPCVGLRVLDLSTMVSGPMGGQIFGDLGADVIKVESISGDTMRAVVPQYKGLGAYFSHYNRNKRSIAVDLKSAEGQQIVRALALQSDLLIENFRPGVADRLQLGYESLRDENPGIVYISIKGFGESGPDSDQPAYDPVIQALAGFCSVQGADTDTPAPVRNVVVDKIAAISGAMSALAALYARDRNEGRGQKIVVKMLDAWSSFISQEELKNHTFINPEVLPVQSGSIYRVFKTKDGHVMGLVLQDNQFRGLCAALGRSDLLEDGRFAKPRDRLMNITDFNEELAASIAEMTTEELLAGVRKYEVPMAKIHSLEEFLDHPQAKHNDTFPIFDDPEFGKIRGLNFYASFEGTPLELRSRAPLLGEQTEEILGEIGMEDAAVRRLMDAQVVR